MEIVGLIVQAERGSSEALSQLLAGKEHVTLYGVRDNRIVLMLDTDDIHIIARSTKEINDMSSVVGVYPVFTKEALPF